MELQQMYKLYAEVHVHIAEKCKLKSSPVKRLKLNWNWLDKNFDFEPFEI